MSTFAPELNKTAFGELKTAEVTPVVQLQFPYNINSQLVKANANQSGTVDTFQNMARLQSGAGANSSGEIYSKVSAKYNPGQGGIVRFTAIYGAQAGDNKQHVGIGNHEDGYFFSQTPAGFGISSRQGGAIQVQMLTVDTASDTSEDITVTLNGDSKTDVAVTNNANKTIMANEIAAADYSQVGRGWDTFAVGETVCFVSWGPGPKAGTYEIADVAGSAAVTFSQLLAGVAHVDAFVAQTDWNLDPMLGDGRGDSGITLDTTKGNVYQIQYQWLGFGSIEYSIEHPVTGEFIDVHRIQYPNNNTRPSINNPSIPLYAASINLTNTTNVTTLIGSMMVGTEGVIEPHGYTHGVAVQDSPGTASEVPIMSVRNTLVHQGVFNRVTVKALLISAGVEHNKPVTINIYKNAVLTSASFSSIDADTSVVETDTTATAFSGGTLLLSIPMGRTGTQTINLDRDDAGLILPGDIFTMTAQPVSGTTHDVAFSLNFLEQF